MLTESSIDTFLKSLESLTVPEIKAWVYEHLNTEAYIDNKELFEFAASEIYHSLHRSFLFREVYSYKELNYGPQSKRYKDIQRIIVHFNRCADFKDKDLLNMFATNVPIGFGYLFAKGPELTVLSDLDNDKGSLLHMIAGLSSHSHKDLTSKYGFHSILTIDQMERGLVRGLHHVYSLSKEVDCNRLYIECKNGSLTVGGLSEDKKLLTAYIKGAKTIFNRRKSTTNFRPNPYIWFCANIQSQTTAIKSFKKDILKAFPKTKVLFDELETRISLDVPVEYYDWNPVLNIKDSPTELRLEF